jgi:hypothetical protein
MTNLSPAAQAVMDSGRQYATQAWSDATHQRFNLGIAAALRAAAEHLSYQLPFEDFGRIDVIDLLAIADELEALSND